MKKFFSLLFVCSIYFIIAVATKKNTTQPVCSNQIDQYLFKDTSNYCQYDKMYHDTIVIFCQKDTSTLAQKAQDLCKIFKDSCGVINKKILLVGNTTNPNAPITPYGKQLYMLQCP